MYTHLPLWHSYILTQQCIHTCPCDISYIVFKYLPCYGGQKELQDRFVEKLPELTCQPYVSGIQEVWAAAEAMCSTGGDQWLVWEL